MAFTSLNKTQNNFVSQEIDLQLDAESGKMGGKGDYLTIYAEIDERNPRHERPESLIGQTFGGVTVHNAYWLDEEKKVVVIQGSILAAGAVVGYITTLLRALLHVGLGYAAIRVTHSVVADRKNPVKDTIESTGTAGLKVLLPLAALGAALAVATIYK